MFIENGEVQLFVERLMKSQKESCFSGRCAMPSVIMCLNAHVFMQLSLQFFSNFKHSDSHLLLLFSESKDF